MKSAGIADRLVGLLDDAPRTCADLAALLPRELGASSETVRSTLNALAKNGRATRVAGVGRWAPTLWTASPKGTT